MIFFENSRVESTRLFTFKYVQGIYDDGNCPAIVAVLGRCSPNFLIGPAVEPGYHVYMGFTCPHGHRHIRISVYNAGVGHPRRFGMSASGSPRLRGTHHIQKEVMLATGSGDRAVAKRQAA